MDDLEGRMERLVAAGAKSVSAPRLRSWGEVVGYVADFDGHLLALARPRPPEPQPLQELAAYLGGDDW